LSAKQKYVNLTDRKSTRQDGIVSVDARSPECVFQIAHLSLGRVVAIYFFAVAEFSSPAAAGNDQRILTRVRGSAMRRRRSTQSGG